MDLLVGWTMDNGLSEPTRVAMLSSYSKFRVYWATYLPFGVGLLSHFLEDMHSIVNDLAIIEDQDTEEYKERWSIFVHLFG